MELTAKGQQGVVTFDGATVTITTKGFFGAATKGRGEKRIPISQITAVQFKPAGRVTQGHIGFTIPGGSEKQSRAMRNNNQAWEDENSMTFLYGANGDFQALRDAVEARMGSQGNVTISGADEVGKLAALHAQGVLSDDEFAAAKAKALGL